MRKNIAFPALLLIICLCFSSCRERGVQSVAKTSFAMGSVVTVTVYSQDSELAENAAQGIIAEIGSLDRLISKNNADAGLYKINQSSGREVEVDSELFGYLTETAGIYASSDKKLSVSSGALTELWGFDTDEFRVPTHDEIDRALPLCDDSLVSFDKEQLKVKTAEGQLLNLGSVGKGIACDKAVEYLKNNSGCSGAAVTVGGSVGFFGSKGNGEDWTLGIRDPYGNENSYFAIISIKGEAFVSTSGSYEKAFESDGKSYHHLLDLTTGYPAESELVSVTVKAPTGLLSDALSTMCFILGEQQSKPLLERYGACAVFVYADKTVSTAGNLDGVLEIVNGEYKLK